MQIKERRVADWCRREHEKYEGNRNKKSKIPVSWNRRCLVMLMGGSRSQGRCSELGVMWSSSRKPYSAEERTL